MSEKPAIGQVLLVFVMGLGLTGCGGTSDVSLSSSSSSSSSSSNNDLLQAATPANCAPPAGAKYWSHASSWPNGKPVAGQSVTVAEDQRLILDENFDLNNVMILGEVYCADVDLNLAANKVTVYGTLRCGCENGPYTKNMTFTLKGNDPALSQTGMGTKTIGVMSAGTLELHGLPRVSWSQLAATAQAGSSEVVMDSDVDWRPGDRIVISSTDFDMRQAETRTILAVRGREVSLDSALNFMHYGQVHNYSNGSSDWTLDMRAEVGLLNRNIVIEGDSTSNSNGFGGHIMSMAGSQMRISNVEMNRMGQKGIKARYPIHWHLVGNGAGQYIKNSSIHHSYQRCITVHATDKVLVDSNLCYDHFGHGIFLEDGVERGNVITNNLVLLTRRPDAANALLPSDRGMRGEDATGPASFWLANPDNVVRGNVSAGSDGSGFWYASHRSPVGLSTAIEMNPSAMSILEFSQNKTHSAGGFAMVLGATESDGPGSTYEPAVNSLMKDSSYYKTRARGVWIHGNNVTLDNFVMADNARGAFFSFRTELRNSLIVGESPNLGNPKTTLELDAGRSLANTDGSVAGYVLYDGPVRFDNIHFAGFGRNAPNVYIFANNGAAFHSMNNEFRRISFAPDTLRIYPETYTPNNNNGQRHAAIIDADGSISSRSGSYLVLNDPMNTNQNCVQGPWSSHRWVSCYNKHGAIRYWADFGSGYGKGLEPIEIMRSDGPVVSNLIDNNKHWYQAGLIANQGYIYRFSFQTFPRASRILAQDFTADDILMYELTPVPATYQITWQGQALAKASSLQDLKSGAANREFRSGTSIYLKVRGGTVEIK